jgi:hypothetical protein
MPIVVWTDICRAARNSTLMPVAVFLVAAFLVAVFLAPVAAFPAEPTAGLKRLIIQEKCQLEDRAEGDVGVHKFGLVVRLRQKRRRLDELPRRIQSVPLPLVGRG